MDLTKRNLVRLLLSLDEDFSAVIKSGLGLERSRRGAHKYLNLKEEYWNSSERKIHPLKLIAINRCIGVLRAILLQQNESKAGFSALGHLLKIVKGQEAEEGSRGFLFELIHLIKGINGKSGIYEKDDLRYPLWRLKGREAAVARSKELDEISRRVWTAVSRYKSGLAPELLEKREKMKKRILALLGGSASDWTDYRWQLRHIYRTEPQISSVVRLEQHEKEAVGLAQHHGIPFGITPYYLSLFDEKTGAGYDACVRAQVILRPAEVCALAEGRARGAHELDFMLESETSPVDLVTRRYPQVAIFKPVNTCPQICSYCQRNWEVDPPMFPGAFYKSEKLDRAMDWFEKHRYVSEVLVTGGDPLLLANDKLDRILSRFSGMKHIQRIRIGTRFPVTIPFRITERFMDMVSRHHVPGRREVCFVTHFEHPAEITPQAVEALALVRRKGIGIYNQTVYTFHNSRRFENVALRKLLRLAGVDPYYTFNTKGKRETESYRVPIARVLQELNEEARLVPGLERTDEPVFNIPGLGKNYLKAGQNHRVISIHPDGSRIIEFHPWEKKIVMADTYVFKDIPILTYLQRLKESGEDPNDYRTIWYYY